MESLNLRTKKILDDIKENFKFDGGITALHFFMNMCSSVPCVGGTVAAISNLHQAKNQGKLDDLLIQWLCEHEQVLGKIEATLNSPSPKVTEENMFMHLSQILGEIAIRKLINQGRLNVVLHDSTYNELIPYIQEGFLEMTCTNCSVSLGCGNSVGNDCEDLKRPFGMGTGWIIKLKNCVL